MLLVQVSPLTNHNVSVPLFRPCPTFGLFWAPTGFPKYLERAWFLFRMRTVVSEILFLVVRIQRSEHFQFHRLDRHPVASGRSMLKIFSLWASISDHCPPKWYRRLSNSGNVKKQNQTMGCPNFHCPTSTRMSAIFQRALVTGDKLLLASIHLSDSHVEYSKDSNSISLTLEIIKTE